MNESDEKSEQKRQAALEAAKRFNPEAFIRDEDARQRPRRHHYVPKFYLRRFAHKKKLAAYRRPGGKRSLMSVNNAAVETDLYTVMVVTGQLSGLMEYGISLFEQKAAPVIAKLAGSDVELSQPERVAMADYIGLQYLRTPTNKQQQDLMMTDMMRWIMRFPWTDELVRSTLRQVEGQEPSDEDVESILGGIKAGHFEEVSVSVSTEEWMKTSVSQVKDVSAILLSFNWVLVVAHGSEFVTSDNPVVLWANPETNPTPGVGFQTADEIRLPLSPKKMLVITPDDHPDRSIKHVGPADVEAANGLSTARSFKWVFQHPQGPDISHLVPDTENPVLITVS